MTMTLKLEDLENSDVFLYNENNYAGYFSYSKDWKKWNFKSGLRVEYTHITGNSISTSIINKSKYIKFFPSFSLLNKLNDKNDFLFSITNVSQDQNILS